MLPTWIPNENFWKLFYRSYLFANFRNCDVRVDLGSILASWQTYFTTLAKHFGSLVGAGLTFGWSFRQLWYPNVSPGSAFGFPGDHVWKYFGPLFGCGKPMGPQGEHLGALGTIFGGILDHFLGMVGK